MASGIRVADLSFHFGDKPVLSNISFELPVGEAMVVLGPSGVGKTTLLRVLAGLLPPKSGVVDMPQAAGDGVPARIVFQEPRLFPWLSVRNNIAFALKSAEIPKEQWSDRYEPLLKQAGLEKAIDMPVRALSGGMAQRVALVRGLCVSPRVLLLDEPFSALDPRLRGQLQDSLLDLIRFTGVSVVMVTHDLDEALKIADEILYVNGEPAQIQLRVRPKEADAKAAIQRLSHLVKGE